MKEKSSKKESIKKDREKEEDASSLVSAEPQNALSRQELKIDWPAFIVWVNNALDKYKSTIPRIEFITPSSFAIGPVFQRSGVFADGMSEVLDLGQGLVDRLMWT